MENDLVLTTLRSNRFMVKNAVEAFKEYRLQVFLKSRESDNEVLSATIPILSNDGLKMLEVMVKEKLDQTLTNAESRAVFQRTEHGLVLILDVLKQGSLKKRFGSIMEAISTFDAEPLLHIEKSMLEVEGKLLPAAKLMFGGPREDLETLRKPTEIEKWVIASFHPDKNLDEVARKVIHYGETLGMNFSKPSLVMEENKYIKEATEVRVHRMLKRLKLEDNPVQLILCLLPKRSKLFGDWKKLCLRHQIVSQCLSSIKENVWKNMLMKINVKLGGLNFKASYVLPYTIQHYPTLISGVHELKIGLAPPIVSVVGSQNSDFTKFKAFVLQEINKSSRDPFENSMVKLCEEFKEITGFAPIQVVIFRDGDMETCTELIDHLRQVFLLANMWLKLTVITVSTNHGSKFFKANGNDIGVGTVIDSKIVCTNSEFYLCSHKAQCGTPTPRLYHINLNEIGLIKNDLEKLTYNLCHGFQQNKNSIADVTPLKYARQAAHKWRNIVNSSNPVTCEFTF